MNEFVVSTEDEYRSYLILARNQAQQRAQQSHRGSLEFEIYEEQRVFADKEIDNIPHLKDPDWQALTNEFTRAYRAIAK